MTNQEWIGRMELLEASVIAENWIRTTSKPTGCWVMLGFGIDRDVAVMTGTDGHTRPELPCGATLAYRWGTLVELAELLGISGIAYTVHPVVFADAILDRVITGTWDNSRDSPLVTKGDAHS